MPPKRKKIYTQKQKKRTGRKQKNTTFKNTAQVGGRKSLEDALSEKLTDGLVQKLIDYPDRKYSILIDFCSDNSFVVNTMKLLDESSLASEGVYTPYKNKLTISNDFEQGKLLEIIIKVDKDVIQYATAVKEKNEFDNKLCIDENLPVIYHIPEITTTSPDFMPEQAQINMNDLVVEDLEDVSDSYINSSVTAPSADQELETKIDRLAHEARLRAEEEAEKKRLEEEAKRKAEEDEPEDDFDVTAITERIEEDDEIKVEFIANIAALQANVIDAAVRNPDIADTIHKLKSDIIKSWNTGFIKDTIIKTIGKENNTNLQNIFENVLCRLYPLTFGKYEAPLSEGIFGYGEGSYNAKHSHTVDAIEGINYYLGTLINDKLPGDIETNFINDVSTFINDFKKKDGFNYIEGCHNSELVKGKCPVDTLKCKNADENTKEATTIIADFENIGARLKTNQYNEKKSFSKDFVRIDGKLQSFIQHINNKGLTANLAKIKTNISSKNATDDIQPIFIKQNIELLKKFIENYVSEKSKTQGGKKTRKNRRKTKQRKTKRRA